jgi:hypothetical protein
MTAQVALAYALIAGTSILLILAACAALGCL